VPDLRPYFAFRGRLSRLGYWRLWLKITIAGAIVWCLGLFAILAFGPAGGVLLVLMIPYFIATAAIVVRRLHDRNRSGFWAIVFLFCPGLAAELAGKYLSGAPILQLVLLLAASGVAIWGVVEIAFRRGTPGPNSFGDEQQASA
jgi:uncharacterized membrane protein YhaH (DUF805 family)